MSPSPPPCGSETRARSSVERIQRLRGPGVLLRPVCGYGKDIRTPSERAREEINALP